MHVQELVVVAEQMVVVAGMRVSPTVMVEPMALYLRHRHVLRLG